MNISMHKARLPKFSKRPLHLNPIVKLYDNYSGPRPMFHATHASHICSVAG